MTDQDDIFCGWAVAALATHDGQWVLRAFTVGTFHEEDAREYARIQVARDHPGWDVHLTTHQLRGLREVTRPGAAGGVCDDL